MESRTPLPYFMTVNIKCCMNNQIILYPHYRF